MAKESKHTPGPWEAEPMEDGCSVSYRINDAHGYEIGVTSGSDGNGEEEANARLIAAAPDMWAELDCRVGDLVMLRRAIEEGDPKAELFIRIDDMLRETRAALAKAGASS